MMHFPPLTKDTIHVGDTVVIRHRDRTSEATVTKVGYAWVTVKGWSAREYRYRMTDRRLEGDTGVRATLYLPAEVEELKLEDDAYQYLCDQGIRLDPGSPWRKRRRELAGLIRSANAPEVAGE